MSKQLAISSTLSVLAMSLFALLGPHTAQQALLAEAHAGPSSLAAVAMPQPSAWVQSAR